MSCRTITKSWPRREIRALNCLRNLWDSFSIYCWMEGVVATWWLLDWSRSAFGRQYGFGVVTVGSLQRGERWRLRIGFQRVGLFRTRVVILAGVKFWPLQMLHPFSHWSDSVEEKCESEICNKASFVLILDTWSQKIVQCISLHHCGLSELMGSNASGRQLSSSRVMGQFESWLLYDWRFIFQHHNSVVTMIGFSSLWLAYLLGLWADFSGAHVFSRLTLMATNSFIRL